MAYIPIPEDQLYCYGELPDTSGGSALFDLTKSNIPSTAQEVLVYLWATTKGDEEFHRFYYKIHTTDGKQLYIQYMNVAASKDVSLNSANLWLPVLILDAPIVVLLEDAENPTEKGKSIAHRCQKKCFKDGTEKITFSGFFILGYR